jgi:hypothetical protein
LAARHPKIYKGLNLCKILSLYRVSFNPVNVSTTGHSVSDGVIQKRFDTTWLEEPTWQMVANEHNQVAQMLFGSFICMSDSAHEIILKNTHHEITGVNTMLKEPLQRLDMSHWQKAVHGVC